MRLRETGGGEYNIKAVAADEFSAARIAKYSLSDEARTKTRVIGVMADDRG